MSTYILVADSGQAKLFKTDSRFTELELVQQQANPSGRLTRSELESDRPGMQLNDMGGAHGLGGDKNSHQHESDVFAKSLCATLQTEYQHGSFSNLIIAAPPHFLGNLRSHLSKDCLKILSKEVKKDLVRMDTPGLLAHLA
jgi:protein required for attachment to host cells